MMLRAKLKVGERYRCWSTNADRYPNMYWSFLIVGEVLRDRMPYYIAIKDKVDIGARPYEDVHHWDVCVFDIDGLSTNGEFCIEDRLRPRAPERQGIVYLETSL